MTANADGTPELKLQRKMSIMPEIAPAEEFCKLHHDGKEFKIPILEGVDGLKLLDI